MSYYTTQILGAGESPIEIRTPGYVLGEMRTVDATIAQLLKDASRVPGLAKEFLDAFASFVKEWVSFYDENRAGFGAWWARGTTSVYRKVLEFRERAAQWRAELAKRGVTLNSPALPEAKSNKLKWGLLALGGGVGIWYLFLRDRR